MKKPEICEGTSDPIPLDLCRELLGAESEGLSDENVEVIHRHADGLANVLIDAVLQDSSKP